MFREQKYRTKILIVIITGAFSIASVLIPIVISNYFSNEKKNIEENRKSPLQEEKKKTSETTGNESNTYNEIPDDLIEKFNTISDLSAFGSAQSGNIYRQYLKLYDSLPTSIRSKIKNSEVRKAKKADKLGDYRKASLIMKQNLEKVIIDN